MSKELKILLAYPRGFCAGVDRAIEIVKKNLNKILDLRFMLGMKSFIILK